jgi:hypothetical protein
MMAMSSRLRRHVTSAKIFIDPPLTAQCSNATILLPTTTASAPSRHPEPHSAACGHTALSPSLAPLDQPPYHLCNLTLMLQEPHEHHRLDRPTRGKYTPADPWSVA